MNNSKDILWGQIFMQMISPIVIMHMILVFDLIMNSNFMRNMFQRKKYAFTTQIKSPPLYNR